MINIWIDVHKRTCVVTVKGDTPEILEQAEFRSNPGGISSLAERVKRRYGGHAIKAVCYTAGHRKFRL